MSSKIYNQLSIIVKLRQQGRPASEVTREVRKADPTITYASVSRFLKKFEGPDFLRAPNPRILHAHSNEIAKEIERCYTSNSSATATDVVQRLRTRGISTNVSTVKRMRHKLGFKRTTTKYCHTIREQNQAARVDFCSEGIEEGRTYSNCVFTDECTVQSESFTAIIMIGTGHIHHVFVKDQRY